MSKPADTPLMQQHKAIKQKYPDAILLFRVGDFYETFGEDAIIASQVLGITLTKRNNGAAASSELAGFPHHSLETYLHKLVRAGHRVAICDQLEDPKQAKGIVKRGVTEMVTPGIATNEKLLEHNSNNFLCCIHYDEKMNGIAFLDISTGEFFVAEGNHEYIEKLLQTLKPAEVIFQRTHQKTFRESHGNKFHIYAMENWIFDENYCNELLLKQFGTHSLKGFGIENMHAAVIASGAILHYLKDTEHPHLQHVTSIQRMMKDEYLWMDQFTIRNLELAGGAAGNTTSLLQTIDQTQSPMGARLLKRWLLLPLIDIQKINRRLDMVEYLIKDADFRQTITNHIKQCGDIERLVSRIPLRKINPRELKQIAKGLEHVSALIELTSRCTEKNLQHISGLMHHCHDIREKIEKQIVDTPPVQVNKGGIIATGINASLDDLREIASSGKEYLLKLQQKETEKTGISSLKIGFNNVFGYFLEVTHAHKNKVPADWIRKQTLTNAERYVTPELKEYEEKIMGAEDKILQLEMELYENLVA
ncbi:MAG: DNA mismatch repair protein MutS, partial [Chitinophagaceae bacterium]